MQLLQSGILMLRHIGESDAADRVEKAMLAVFEEGKVRTRDIGGTAKTSEFSDAIIAAFLLRIWDCGLRMKKAIAPPSEIDNPKSPIRNPKSKGVPSKNE